MLVFLTRSAGGMALKRDSKKRFNPLTDSEIIKLMSIIITILRNRTSCLVGGDGTDVKASSRTKLIRENNLRV